MQKLFTTGLAVASMAIVLTVPHLTWAQATRQGRGNFDPQQARQQAMDRYRERLEVKNDAEWAVIEPRIQKVLDARRELGGGGMGFFMRRGRGGNTGNAGSDQPQAPQRTRRGNPPADQAGPGRRGPEPSPAMKELQQAVESNASSDEMKAKLAAYREERKQKQATLQAAQDDLRKILSLKQEANAVIVGLLQ